MLPLQATSCPTTDGVDGCECNADRHSVARAPSALTQPRRVGLGSSGPSRRRNPSAVSARGSTTGSGHSWASRLVPVVGNPSDASV